MEKFKHALSKRTIIRIARHRFWADGLKTIALTLIGAAIVAAFGIGVDSTPSLADTIKTVSTGIYLLALAVLKDLWDQDGRKSRLKQESNESNS